MSELLQILIGVGVVIGGLGYAYGQFREGSAKYKLDTINLLKEDVQTLRKEVEELTTEVHKLREENTIERKKFADAILAIQGRDPQMQVFMDVVKAYVDGNKPLLDEIRVEVMPVVKKLDKYLDKQVI